MQAQIQSLTAAFGAFMAAQAHAPATPGGVSAAAVPPSPSVASASTGPSVPREPSAAAAPS
eukprot:3608625-Prorocentrum_lima.AAC.1